MSGFEGHWAQMLVDHNRAKGFKYQARGKVRTKNIHSHLNG